MTILAFIFIEICNMRFWSGQYIKSFSINEIDNSQFFLRSNGSNIQIKLVVNITYLVIFNFVMSLLVGS